ncbi:hypothetical protein J6590_049060 [Homalodisca vitripennis]|nr:hypothetical protein J6590_049060 [Homalodisca vitripennis]
MKCFKPKTSARVARISSKLLQHCCIKIYSHTSVPARHRSVTSVTSQSKNVFYNGFPVALSTLIRLSSGAGPSVALPASSMCASMLQKRLYVSRSSKECLQTANHPCQTSVRMRPKTWSYNAGLTPPLPPVHILHHFFSRVFKFGVVPRVLRLVQMCNGLQIRPVPSIVDLQQFGSGLAICKKLRRHSKLTLEKLIELFIEFFRVSCGCQLASFGRLNFSCDPRRNSPVDWGQEILLAIPQLPFDLSTFLGKNCLNIVAYFSHNVEVHHLVGTKCCRSPV